MLRVFKTKHPNLKTIMPAYFITATDTDVGKTYITSKLIQTARLQKIDAIALKPIASGVIRGETSDLDILYEANQKQLTKEQLNVYQFKAAIAPHLAAKQENQQIDIHRICQAIEVYKSKQLLLIEGVGGWMVPLNEKQTLGDLVKQLDIAVIVVVKIKLGCINHALLTFAAIKQSGINIKGWIANGVTDAFSLQIIKEIEHFSGLKALATIAQQTTEFPSKQFEELLLNLQM